MIVELFGPPCSGKTVFASRLAARLRQRGLDVVLHVSSRGNEVGGPYEAIFDRATAPGFPTFYRLWRPVVELASQAKRSSRRLENDEGVALLVQLGVTRSTLHTLRFRHYVRRLARLWRMATRREAVSIFDQGYIQACCSALLMNPSVSDAELTHALRSLPRADVLVRVEAPIDVLEARLQQRMSHLDPVGRLLETSIGIRAANMTEHMAAIDRLDSLLMEDERPVYVTWSDDAASQESCVAAISGVWNRQSASRTSHETVHHHGQKR